MPMPTTATATERVLVACCRVDGDVAIEAGVDWERFERLASWHRVAGVAYKALRGAGEAGRLEAAYTETFARNLVSLAELDRIARELEGAGITGMLLKGAALLGGVYKDYGTRPMYDLDLLLRQDDVARAGAVLSAVGYRPAPQFASQAELLWDRHGRWVPLVRADGLVVVELHRRLGGEATVLGLDVDGWWARARPTERASLLRPSPEDLLTHVALHALGDRRLRSEGALGQLRDVARVAAGGAGEIDWERLGADARRAGFGPALALVLEVVAELGLAAVPPAARAARAALAPSGVDRGLVDEVVKRRVLRDDRWVTLERLGPRTSALRQLLPPRLGRLRARRAGAVPGRDADWVRSVVGPYAAWAGATARIVARSGDVRGEVSFDRAVRSLLSRAGA